MSDVWQSFREYDLEQRKAQQTAFQKLQEKKKERPVASVSPIELAFSEAWHETYPMIELLQQYHIDRYRVDFAHPDTMTVIELDGHQTHHSRKDRTYDAQRARVIQRLGWRLLRFTGTEIHANVEDCVRQAWEYIQQGW
jgi:very-short-patch-repair endonuclease